MTEELQEERGQLAKAELDIAEGRERIRHQMDLIRRLQRDGHPVDQAKALLTNLEDTLRAWQTHQSAIIERIKYLEETARARLSIPRMS
jgi:hypothetical protein